MSAGDWIAVGSAVVAVVTALVMYRQLAAQRASAKEDLQDQFDGLISTLAGLQATFAETSVPGLVSAGSPQAAKQLGLGNQLQVVGGQAEQMLHPPKESDPTPSLSWYSAWILAQTCEMTWHVGQAKGYWDEAIERAKQEKAPQAQISSLMGRARHFFNRNDENENDSESGRQDYLAALDLLDPLELGHDANFHQKAAIHYELMIAEQSVNNTAGAVHNAWECWRAVSQIRTPWRYLGCLDWLFTYVAQTGLGPRLSTEPGIGPIELQAFTVQLEQWMAHAQFMALNAARQSAGVPAEQKAST
jgi:hypothetical protein